MMFEDTNGFVHFPPIHSPQIISTPDKKTLVYLVAFDWMNINNKKSTLSNIKMNSKGTLVSDDINGISYIKSDIGDPTTIYFPNKNSSIPLITSICIGWDEVSYKIRTSESEGQDWFCTFRDLTNEGRKLYYSIKKIHNNKEVRLLTFNNI